MQKYLERHDLQQRVKMEAKCNSTSSSHFLINSRSDSYIATSILLLSSPSHMIHSIIMTHCNNSLFFLPTHLFNKVLRQPSVCKPMINTSGMLQRSVILTYVKTLLYISYFNIFSIRYHMFTYDSHSCLDNLISCVCHGVL